MFNGKLQRFLQFSAPLVQALPFARIDEIERYSLPRCGGNLHGAHGRIGVVLAAAGYPDAVRKGDPIHGLAAAARLLSDATLSVKAIAFDLGYVSLTTFERDFKRVFGVTPTDWRQVRLILGESTIFHRVTSMTRGSDGRHPT